MRWRTIAFMRINNSDKRIAENRAIIHELIRMVFYLKKECKKND